MLDNLGVVKKKKKPFFECLLLRQRTQMPAEHTDGIA